MAFHYPSSMLPSKIAILALFLLLIFLYFLSTFLRPNNQTKHPQKRPPGPLGLPIIGHFHLLGKLPHRSLYSLSKKYGPMMSLRLGQIPTIVVSSPELTKLFLKTLDPKFANRPKVQVTDLIFYGSKGMAFGEYSPYWCDMRKLCNQHVLGAPKIALFGPLRKQELALMVKSLQKDAKLGEVVNVGEKVHGLMKEIVYKMIFGRSNDDEFDLEGLVSQALNLVGEFNLADYVPWLGAFDLQGITRRAKEIGEALDKALEKIVREHEEEASNAQKEGHHRDFIDILLSLMNQPLEDGQEHGMERENIKAIALDVILGSYDTAIVAIEWAFTELLRNPRVMKKLQHELETIVGMDKMVEEADIPKLNYLHMVVKETLRLRTVGPFIIRETLEDVTVNGYYIKKKTRILVNLWAMGQNPTLWSDNVEEFYPERFLNNDVNISGNDFQLTPFGSGRRKCPGMLIGLTTVNLVLAQLVHCFNWELPHGMTPCDVDLSETFGLTISRSKPLLAVPTCRVLV
ncbi:cytochrome P450 CYP736A12-like [Senna tora]|uniref:Cytochrome P450 CYP736A12-like n=2 Tax=Senna tora TaxID=362788 RepID=A0A834T3J5_9FABA|nr:cytochrome P450 CYP736A12-like [Senna tora]